MDGEESIENVDVHLEEDDWQVTDDTPWYLRGPKVFKVPSLPFSDGDVSTDTDAPTRNLAKYQLRQGPSMVNLGPDYWQIRKLMKFMKAGDESTTVVSLACLADYDLMKPENQYAIVDTGGIEILINTLGVQSIKCIVGALRTIKELIKNKNLAITLINMGILCELIALLCHSESDIIILTVQIIDVFAEQRKTRTIIRKLDGIPMLMEMVDIDQKILFNRRDRCPKHKRLCLEIAITSVHVLTQLSKSRKVRSVLYENGILKVLKGLLTAKEEELRISGLKMITNCASLPEFRKSFEIDKTLKTVLNHWKDPEREELVLRIIFKCSVSKIGRNQVVEFGALERLVNLVKSPASLSNPKTFKYAVGCVYRLGVHPGVRDKLNSYQLIPTLIRLLSYEKESVLIYITGILSFMTSYPSNWKLVKDSGGLEPLMHMLQYKAESKLMSNVARIIGDIAHDPSIMKEMTNMEVLRLLWSLLNSKSPRVQEQAARALVPVIKQTPDAGEEIRNLSGALDIIMGLLDSDDLGVVAGGCETLAKVAMNPENLGILTQMGIVPKICELVNVQSDVLRESLGVVIAGVASDPKDSFELGRLGCIKPLVQFLGSSNIQVVISAAYALWKLSYDPINCISLHQAGVVPFLIQCVKSENKSLQEAAGGCLYNIRNLAHDTEEMKCFTLQDRARTMSEFKARESVFIPRPAYPDDVEY
ncbi:armadillo repeat-containing protein gudu-like isoform X1 [Cimex lectularius]|uniref:Armadillo repeat-containing protein gudu n=2 Tax=Cimex lectularius TaxID=79782 RepID=A0A8I6TDK5_CIMLE|nr:armadillo repeat-containing protein gudu-like isoform X1 [Cimex lectularius]